MRSKHCYSFEINGPKFYGITTDFFEPAIFDKFFLETDFLRTIGTIVPTRGVMEPSGIRSAVLRFTFKRTILYKNKYTENMFNTASRYYSVLPSKAFMLLVVLEKYVNGATRQMARIERSKEAIELAENTKDIPSLFLDVHFYFNCIGVVDESLMRFATTLSNKKLKRIRKKLHTIFDRDIRNAFEHVAEKLTKHDELRDLFNMYGDVLTFDGKRYSVRKTDVTKLRELFKEIIAVIHNEYAMKDPRFVSAQQRAKHDRLMDRKIKAKLLGMPIKIRKSFKRRSRR